MTEKTTQAGRRLRFEIFRYNPEDPESAPRMQSFELDETPYMSIFIALNEIREKQDPSLQFDFVCRAAICGSCGMMVNGRPALGCRTLTSDLPDVIKLHPLPVFKLIGDLSVDTGTWFREMVEKTEGWIHAQEAFDRDAQEARMDDDTAAAIYENDRCIECMSNGTRWASSASSPRSTFRLPSGHGMQCLQQYVGTPASGNHHPKLHLRLSPCSISSLMLSAETIYQKGSSTW